MLGVRDGLDESAGGDGGNELDNSAEFGGRDDYPGTV